GVRVNCICPGRVETPFFTARLREYPDPEQAYRDLAATHPLNRIGKPEEIAAAAAYLASDAAAFITRSALIIEGGLGAGKCSSAALFWRFRSPSFVVGPFGPAFHATTRASIWLQSTASGFCAPPSAISPNRR